mgnify:FL=1
MEKTAPRANTMFKLTYQAYIMFGIMMAYILVSFTVTRIKRCNGADNAVICKGLLRCPKTSGPDRDHCDPASDFNLRIPGKCNHSLVWRIPEKKCIPDTKRNELFGKCDS